MFVTTSQFGRLVGNFGMALTSLVLFYGIYLIQGHVMAALYYWWDKVGFVMLGLLPMTVCLVIVMLYVALGHQPRATWVSTLLKIISFAAPSLGLLGTVLGIVAGTDVFSLANGAQDLLESVAKLMSGLNVALLSTAWGTLLGIPAGVMNMVLFPDEQNQ